MPANSRWDLIRGFKGLIFSYTENNTAFEELTVLIFGCKDMAIGLRWKLFSLSGKPVSLSCVY